MLHRDIKPENVLLDHHWNAKLADVGLSQFLSGTGMISKCTSTNNMLSSALVGTFAYMDPEYVATGQVGSQVRSSTSTMFGLTNTTGMSET